jgi:hypothetical protein
VALSKQDEYRTLLAPYIDNSATQESMEHESEIMAQRARKYKDESFFTEKGYDLEDEITKRHLNKNMFEWNGEGNPYE